MTNSIYLDIFLLCLANIILIVVIIWAVRYKLVPVFNLLKAIYQLRKEGIDFAKEFSSLTQCLLEGSFSVIVVSDRQDKFIYADLTTSAIIDKKDILNFQHSNFFINDTNAHHIQQSRTVQIKLAHDVIKEILFKAVSRRQSQNFNYILEKMKGTNNSYRANLSSHFQKMGALSHLLNDEIAKQKIINNLKQHLAQSCALDSLEDISISDLRKKRDRAIREAGKWLKQNLNIDEFKPGYFEHIIAPVIYEFFGAEHFSTPKMGYTLGTIIKQISINIGEKRK